MLLASASCAVAVIDVPATGEELLVVTRYFVAGPAIVTTFELVPVRDWASVAVNAYVTPAVVLVVNATVATPLASVSEVPVANDPPAPVFVHVTVTPCAATGVFDGSTSCAVMVTGEPAVTLDALVVTRYFVPGVAPRIVVIAGEVPVMEPVVAVTTCVVFTVVLVVNDVVATPLALVLLAPGENDPPFVLVHVTV